MKNKGMMGWLTPVLLAMPWAVAIAFASTRYGGMVKDLIHLAIKLVVTK